MIDVNDVAATVKVSSRTITRWSDAGLMPKGRKLGNLVRWSRAEIEKWVEDGCPKMGAAT
jgi:excisionase family DNA binding protein